MNNKKDINNLKNRLRELADRSYNTGTFTYTDFLGIAEQSDLLLMQNELSYASFELFGGYDDADRRIARFGNPSSLGYEMPYPIVCIYITPLMKKFSDELGHRDFLGALMNLGIERSTLGDIRVNEKEAYLFCLENIAPFIIDNLFKVKHTSVKCSLIDDISKIENKLICDEPISKSITASSLRADGIISKIYNLSRSDSLNLFREQKVYINGRLCENNSQQIKSGDVINARGYGKFRINGDPSDTRKGKLNVNVLVW